MKGLSGNAKGLLVHFWTWRVNTLLLGNSGIDIFMAFSVFPNCINEMICLFLLAFSCQRQTWIKLLDSPIRCLTLWKSYFFFFGLSCIYMPMLNALFFFFFFGHNWNLDFLSTGEVVSVPLPRTITSIWPLPFGLLLEQAAEGSSPTYPPFTSPSSSLSVRNVSRSKRDVGISPQHNFSIANAYDHRTIGCGASMSSHFILKDPLEEP